MTITAGADCAVMRASLAGAARMKISVLERRRKCIAILREAATRPTQNEIIPMMSPAQAML
jgi:hypothetical protein